MHGYEYLYHIATVVGLSSFLSTVFDGFVNYRDRRPSGQLTIFMILSVVSSILRVPALLLDGTVREIVMIGGFLILEGIAVVLNLLAYRYRALDAFALTVLIVTIVLPCMLALKWRKLTSNNDNSKTD